jgi:hypothetical protein
LAFSQLQGEQLYGSNVLDFRLMLDLLFAHSSSQYYYLAAKASSLIDFLYYFVTVLSHFFQQCLLQTKSQYLRSLNNLQRVNLDRGTFDGNRLSLLWKLILCALGVQILNSFASQQPPQGMLNFSGSVPSFYQIMKKP